MADNGTGRILVVGSGMSGLTAAIEAAETGYEVHLVEKKTYLGGRVAQLFHYFPKLCSPNCGLEINFRRIKSNPKIHYYTMAQVAAVSGQEGDFTVSIKQNPRYINEKCTACGECAKACSIEIDNAFNYNMDKVKAAYLPYNMAFPMRYVLDKSLVESDEAEKVKEACKYGAIELDMKAKDIQLQVGSIIWATGWNPYDSSKLDSYQSAKIPDVITNVQLERLASGNGPTQGKILKPSDGQAPGSIAFLQCAGSRDQNHLEFCSGICCLASLKQATYVREQYPDAKIYCFYIDIRATDLLEGFYSKVKSETNVEFIKGKVAQINLNCENKPLLKVEDTTTEQLKELSVDLVVLATGMSPNGAGLPDIKSDPHGFISEADLPAGQLAAGAAKTPGNVSEVVQDGTRAALKAIQSAKEVN